MWEGCLSITKPTEFAGGRCILGKERFNPGRDLMTSEIPTIKSVRARGVNVPMARPLVTGGGTVSTAALVLVDLETSQGVVGRAYVFCYMPMMIEPMAMVVERLGASIQGDSLAPLAIEEKLQRGFRLLGPQGIAGMAMAGIDMAAWDALAKTAGLPLARLLGGEPLPIPAYNSNGMGLIGADKAPAEARELAAGNDVAGGFRAIKVRLGYPTMDEDEEVLDAVEEALNGEVAMMTDYNQCLLVSEAKTRIAMLDDWDLLWVEEPTRADDYAGHGEIQAASGTPIQLGENCWGPHDMAKALEAGSCDLFMADVVKIGGVTGWLRAAALAEPIGMPLSSHLFPEVSVHLLSVTPTRHWLEYVDWANPILKTPLRVENGQALAIDAPGNGLEWDEDGVKEYMV